MLPVEPTRTSILLTCEHAGNTVPPQYRPLFEPHAGLLATHRGYDLGALHLAQTMAEQLGVPLLTTDISRLLVEANRSLHHRHLFSIVTRGLPRQQKEQILQEHYLPHRQMVTAAVQERVDRQWRVVHVAVHSFTPVLEGQVRGAEVGLLYDPTRPGEAGFCRAWRGSLEVALPELRVRMNYPYRGKADGLTTALRRQFADVQYIGIELEVNQRMVTPWDRFRSRWKTSWPVATGGGTEPWTLDSDPDL